MRFLCPSTKPLLQFPSSPTCPTTIGSCSVPFAASGRKEGDHLIFEGAPVEHIYCLLSGKVGVYKKDKEGKKVLIASLGKGFIFGEMSFLDQGPASATVRAGLPFQVLTVNQEALHRLLESQPKLGYKILTAIARQTSLRLRMADDMLARFPGLTNEFTIA